MNITVPGCIGDDTEVTIEAVYSSYRPEGRDPPTPAEPAEVVIEAVYIDLRPVSRHKDDILPNLNAETIEQMENYCWAYLEDDWTRMEQ